MDSVTRSAADGVRSRDSQPSRQREAERFVLNAAFKARRVRLENMRRRRPIHGNADITRVVHRDGELRLYPSEGHRYSLVADQERLGREFLDDTLKLTGLT